MSTLQCGQVVLEQNWVGFGWQRGRCVRLFTFRGIQISCRLSLAEDKHGPIHYKCQSSKWAITSTVKAPSQTLRYLSLADTEEANGTGQMVNAHSQPLIKVFK